MSATKNYWYPMAIIGTLFFIFGFLTWVNGILIPFFQICLELSNLQALLVVLASFSSYFIMALPSAWVLKYTGYKKGMGLGLFVMAVGTLLFIPAAYTRLYPIFLTGLFITGTGLTLLQTAANPYVAIIGPIESTAQRIGIMGICNKVAGIISTTILGSIFLFNADDVIVKLNTLAVAEKAKLLSDYSLKVVGPYLIISAVLVLLGVLILFSKLPEVDETETVDENLEDNFQPKESIVQYPYLILGVIALLFASACEGIPVDGIVLYGRLLGIKVDVARHFATYTLYAMLAGYLFTVIAVPKYFSQQQALRISAIWGLALATISFIFGGIVSIYCIILMGFGSAMLWGTIWGLSLRNLGRFTKQGSALLLMTVIGGGIFPVIYGKLLDINARTAIAILIPCYLFLLFYSSYGYRITKWKKATNKMVKAQNPVDTGII
jgi:MFS transporter, FHS family, L-fucose permease